MKKTELIKTLSFLGDSYPGKFKYPTGDDVKDASFEETWMIFLKDYSYKTIMLVLVDFIPKHPEWPPTVGEVVNRVEDISKEDNVTAEEAWEKALRIAVTTSRYQKDPEIFKEKNVPDRIIRAIKAVGGLERIRMSKKEDPFFRKSFMDAYNNISERIDTQADPQLSDSVRTEIKRITDSQSTKRLEGK